MTDPIELSVQRQDHVRDVAVHEPEDDRDPLAGEPVPRRDERQQAEDVVHVPVGLEQALPREHPHQVVDEEGCDQEQQEQRLASSAVPGHEVRDGVAEDQADRAREEDVDEGSKVRRLAEGVGAEDAADRLVERVEAPPPRLVDGDGVLEDRVDRAERDGQDHVEREDEQDDQPDRRGCREGWPEPPRVPDARGLLTGRRTRAALRLVGDDARFSMVEGRLATHRL